MGNIKTKGDDKPFGWPSHIVKAAVALLRHQMMTENYM
jgi:hypothetical protein